MGRDQAILNIRQIAAGFGRRLQHVAVIDKFDDGLRVAVLLLQ
jgi:hypothetical protein